MIQFPETTKVTCTNSNPRRELHGDEAVRAIDLTFRLKGSNELLDLIEAGLREHHFCNKALVAGQEALPDVVIPLPNLRHPQLPALVAYAKGQKWRGYRFAIDYGLSDSLIDFTDAVLASVKYELMEGGTVEIGLTVQYNGDELADDEVYGKLAGLAAEGEVHIRLIAPAELTLAKKGYRAGRPDTPQGAADPAQRDLEDGGEDDGDEGDAHGEGEDLDPSTPEGAFAAAAGPTRH